MVIPSRYDSGPDAEMPGCHAGHQSLRGCSSVGRARAFQVRRRRFDPGHPLHHIYSFTPRVFATTIEKSGIRDIP